MSPSIAIIMPVYNDWEACGYLLADLDQALLAWPGRIDIVLLDDGSSQHPPTGIGTGLQRIDTVSILRMRRNLGHQRSICVGLSYIEQEARHSHVVVMDADGEDRPQDVPRLLEISQREPGKVVFARRTRRSEGLIFRLGYHCFRTIHRLLTGQDIRFGSFSVVPRGPLRAITVSAELWNHFAGCVLATRVPYIAADTIRGTRYAGKSTMNLPSLMVHGLSAISLFAPVIGSRLIALFGAVSMLAVIAMLVLAAIRIFTDQAIPGWASILSGISLLALLQSILFIVTFTFLVLGARSQATVIPARDCKLFVDTVTLVGTRHGNN